MESALDSLSRVGDTSVLRNYLQELFHCWLITSISAPHDQIPDLSIVETSGLSQPVDIKAIGHIEIKKGWL
jgi:hypothetical protein